jgi:ribonucleoside-triphosphate reductase
LTFDWIVPDDMKSQPAIVGGREQDFTYGDCQKEMGMINRAFIEVMAEGDAKGRVFTFPIPTYNITKDFDWDSANAKLLFEMTAKYGIPYFQNFVNSSLDPGDIRSMCCRLQMDMRELRMKGNGLFGAAEMTGSVGVVTINLPRIGFLAYDRDDFFKRLDQLMITAKASLEIKRKLVQKHMDDNLMPFSKRYLGNLRNHFSTIGINGMNEACLNFLGKSISTQEGRSFAIDVLEFMNERLKDFQEETGHIFNLEATPAEGTSYRFAKIDKIKYPDIVVANEAAYRESAAPFYTNSTHLPVDFTEDIFEALEHQDELQSLYTGGTVLHGFIGERVSNAEACKKLVKKIANGFKLPYFTITPTFSICPVHGYRSGEHHFCPEKHNKSELESFGDGKQIPCEIFSRVVGYFRPIHVWNKGKRAEFTHRKPYAEAVSLPKTEKP